MKAADHVRSPDSAPTPERLAHLRALSAQYPTIEGLFDLVQNAIDDDAATIRTEYDPARGFLASGYFDIDERIADEELSVEARGLVPLD